MLLRLTSCRLGSLAFICCRLTSTFVGLGGSSNTGLTFSPLTTSKTQVSILKIKRKGSPIKIRDDVPQNDLPFICSDSNNTPISMTVSLLSTAQAQEWYDSELQPQRWVFFTCNEKSQQLMLHGAKSAGGPTANSNTQKNIRG